MLVPVTTILPSACTVTLWPRSLAPLPKSVTSLPVLLKPVSRLPSVL